MKREETKELCRKGIWCALCDFKEGENCAQAKWNAIKKKIAELKEEKILYLNDFLCRTENYIVWLAAFHDLQLM
jgi:hypothetical protein